MQISTIGIDIGKNSFHFVGFDARGGIVEHLGEPLNERLSSDRTCDAALE